MASAPQTRTPPSRRRRLAVAASAMLIVAMLTVALGELVIRLIAPQRSLYPRTAYSRDYGFLPYPDTTMVNEVPGRWRFVYRTNRDGHRGPAPARANRYPRPVVVVLQFCANDPADNLLNPVTVIEDGRLVFKASPSRLESLKRYLSHSLLQKSQIYNLVRDVGYGLWRGREVQAQMRAGATAATLTTPADEAMHMRLLELFAADLQRRGIRLVMFAVDGQLERFPALRHRVAQLHERGLLQYVELMDWFAGGVIETSPEGHWAASAHQVVAAHLARIIEPAK